jgi:DNA topoisomerase-1
MDISDNNILIGGREDSYDIRNYKDGIFRKKINDKFIYYYIKNNNEISQKDLNRIKKLGIPPAWENLWVSNDPKSKIQAVGIDSKGRKQYRYHTEYIEIAEKKKFLRLLDFIKSLPNLENYIKIHSKLNIYDKLKVITTMLKIVKLTYMRVGKEQYARENKSYGISSLKKTHMKISGDIINFNFKGKSKQRLNYILINHDIKSHLQILQKLEGEKLFQYIDIDNKIKKISDKDLNEYIQTFMGKDFTIKDFRTYAANYHFINFLLNETKKRLPKNDKIKKKNILKSLKQTAKFLKHTKAISKKSYVMNFIAEFYMNNSGFFVSRKYDNPNEVLLELLKLYKKSIS